MNAGLPVLSTAEPSSAVKGLGLLRSGQRLESVESSVSRLHLLVSGGNLEITEVELKAGAHLFLDPGSDGDDLTETYYLLSGILECDCMPRSFRLEPGAVVVTQGLSIQVVLTARTPARLLYISPRPYFHAISASVGEMMRLATEIEVKDGYTSDHCQRIQTLSFATGEELGLSGPELYRLNYGAFLHDVGKIRVPLEILNKPSKLTEPEWTVIKRHPTFGREMLESTFMKVAGSVVEQHHERLDGSGYPFGYRGDEVLIESYIVAVADTYDAMTTDRPYRKAMPTSEAFAELQRYAGIHYPQEVVKAFMTAAAHVEQAL